MASEMDHQITSSDTASILTRASDGRTSFCSLEHGGNQSGSLGSGPLHGTDVEAGDGDKDLRGAATNGDLHHSISQPKNSQQSVALDLPEGHGKERARSPPVASDQVEEGIHASLPWLHQPLRKSDGPWLEAHAEASEWISLFYDLSVVAVLQDFSSEHQLGQPGDIPTFLSYFVIIYLIWHTQTQYDIRFQGNDIFHLLLKFLQIGLLLYQGAAAGNWDPGSIQTAKSAELEGPDITYEEQAERSFITVVIAFIVSRLLLAMQYAILIRSGKRAHRPTLPFIVTFGSLIFTAATGIVAVSIPARSESAVAAKLALLYIGVGIEVLEICSAFFIDVRPEIPIDRIRERYGQFILVILGEGSVSLVRALNAAISGLSGSDSSTYVQAFLAIVIIFLLFLFLFTHFTTTKHLGPNRAYFWLLLEFPLAFGLLLFLAAMVNVVSTIAYLNALNLVLDGLTAIGFTDDGGFSSGNGTSPETNRILIKYLNKLAVDPPFSQELGFLGRLANDSSPALDVQVASRQYFAAVLLATIQSYNLEINNGVYSPYASLYSLNTTYQQDAGARMAIDNQSQSLAVDMIVQAYALPLPGILWLLPTAGCVLLLATCRMVLWTPTAATSHRRLLFRFVVPSQLVCGLVLGLLGLLAIGPGMANRETIDNPFEHLSPLYNSLLDEIPLVLTAVMLFLAWFGPRVLARLITKRRRGKEKV